MGRNKKASTPVRIDDDVLLRVKREWPNGTTLRNRIMSAIVFALDNRGKLTQAQFLGRVEPLLDWIDKQATKRKKK